MTGGRTLLVAALLGSAAPCAHAASPVRLAFAGDVMLGRGVATMRAPLAGVRAELSAADLAAANLESPLTRRPHLHGRNALEADPARAQLLAAAGLDAVSVANNHSGDAGPGTVADTVRALRAAGVAPLGIGSRIVAVRGVRIAFLAFDATRAGAVSRWNDQRAQRAVAAARARADVVVVAVHGGAEYVTAADPAQTRICRLLASWGADVVWGQGAHVVQPVGVIDPDHDGRPTVVATSLGNLLFDQHVPGTRTGALLEVVVDRGGARAFRVGTTAQEGDGAHFRAWRAPRGDAAALGTSWWTPAWPVVPVPKRRPASLAGFPGHVVDAALGDADGDGRTDLAVAFRMPYRPTNVSPLFPRRSIVDANGRAAHVGIFRPGDLRSRWVAGTLLRPVTALASCTGALAVAYSTLDSPAVTGTGAWRWHGFGFVSLPDLPGAGTPACADVDHDGRIDPLILRRSTR